MRFFSILKPGILFGNIVTVCGGFFLGATHSALHNSNHTSFFSLFLLLIITLISMSLIVGSGCVFNNIIDRDIDKLMDRTCNRVLVQGLISPKIAFIYAVFVGLAGFLLAYLEINLWAFYIAALGWIFYVIVYSLFLKRKSTAGTLWGSISGAVPPVVGYCAAVNYFDWGALSLFIILFLWQMPHFYAISIYRLKDFTAAKIPVLPAIHTMLYTKITMLIYIISYALATLVPFFLGYAGYIYLIGSSVLGVIWMIYSVQGFKIKFQDPNNPTPEEISKNNRWAKKVFLFSILDITLLCILMGINLI